MLNQTRAVNEPPVYIIRIDMKNVYMKYKYERTSTFLDIRPVQELFE